MWDFVSESLSALYYHCFYSCKKKGRGRLDFYSNQDIRGKTEGRAAEMNVVCPEFICCCVLCQTSVSSFSSPSVICLQFKHFPCMSLSHLLLVSTCLLTELGLCSIFDLINPPPFHPSLRIMSARLFWNVWTGTAYFTLLLIFDRCSGEAHIHIDWSHMHNLHTAVHYTEALHRTGKTFCGGVIIYTSKLPPVEHLWNIEAARTYQFGKNTHSVHFSQTD